MLPCVVSSIPGSVLSLFGLECVAVVEEIDTVSLRSFPILPCYLSVTFRYGVHGGDCLKAVTSLCRGSNFITHHLLL